MVKVFQNETKLMDAGWGHTPFIIIEIGDGKRLVFLMAIAHFIIIIRFRRPIMFNLLPFNKSAHFFILKY